MPTFSYKDEEPYSDTTVKSTTSVIRNWLGSSMDFFRIKKFSQKHAESIDRRKQEKQAESEARAEYQKRFEQQKLEHSATFFREQQKHDNNIILTKNAPKSDELSQSWLEEYNHPSSTANVSIHEIMGLGEVQSENTRPKNNMSFVDSSLDLSSTFNSTAKSLFSTSILGGNGIKENAQKLPTDRLDEYTGARPSFGGTTMTSTPLGKLFSANSNAANNLSPVFPVTHTQQPKLITNQQLVTRSDITTPKQHLKSIPEVTDIIQEPTINAISSNYGGEIVEKKIETPIERKKFFNNLVMYYSKDLDLKEDNDLAKERFGKTGDTALRGTIKRTINEKLIVCSKKHANLQELETAIQFLSKMVSGKVVESHSGQKFQVTQDEAVAYIRDAVISYCMGVVERDNDLVHVLATILRGVSLQNSAFESVLLGHLFNNSVLLTLDNQVCTKFAESLANQPGRRTAIYNKERSAIKMFMALHLNSIGGNHKSSRLDMRYLWRTIAVVFNSPPCVISTVVLAISFLEICADKMRQTYPKQFPKLVRLIKEQLLPLLERNLQSSPLCQAAGEAAFISVLCNELESL